MRQATLPGLLTNTPSSHPLQATEEPVVPAEPLESMLRPFNLVIPFTVQKGELTGNGCPTHETLLRIHLGLSAKIKCRDEPWGPEKGNKLG